MAVLILELVSTLSISGLDLNLTGLHLETNLDLTQPWQFCFHSKADTKHIFKLSRNRRHSEKLVLPCSAADLMTVFA